MLYAWKSSLLFPRKARERQTLLSRIFSGTNPVCEQLSQEGKIKIDEFPKLMLIVFKHSYFSRGYKQFLENTISWKKKLQISGYRLIVVSKRLLYLNSKMFNAFQQY